MKRLCILALFLPLVAMAASYNQTPATPDNGLAYVETNVGTNVLHLDTSDWGAENDVTLVKDLGANVNLGYQINDNFAVETGFTRYMYHDFPLNMVDVAVKGILPFGANKDAKVFAKLGYGKAFADDKDSAEGAVFAGVGLGYRIQKNIDATIQYQAIAKDGSSLGLASLGLAFYF